MIEPEKILIPARRKFNHILQRLKTPEQRFFDYVDKTSSVNGCWLWAGQRSQSGYGKFKFRGKHMRAHRVAWIIAYGLIPDGLQVHHNCPGGDNPACVCPIHLWLGTQPDNIKDKLSKNRQACGEKNGMAKATSEIVRQMRIEHAERKTPYTVLEEQYGIAACTIGQIIRRELWGHVH